MGCLLSGSRSQFEELPLELQLLVADEVDALTDRASLCLALPALGLAALRQLARYDSILMSVALRLARLDQAGKLALLDERLIRLLVADDRASANDCNWLNAVYAEAGSDLQVQLSDGYHKVDPKCTVGQMCWSLSVSGEDDAVLRLQDDDLIVHFEGEKDAERVVRFGHRDLLQLHFDQGDEGATEELELDGHAVFALCFKLTMKLSQRSFNSLFRDPGDRDLPMARAYRLLLKHWR